MPIPLIPRVTFMAEIPASKTLSKNARPSTGGGGTRAVGSRTPTPCPSMITASRRRRSAFAFAGRLRGRGGRCEWSVILPTLLTPPRFLYEWGTGRPDEQPVARGGPDFGAWWQRTSTTFRRSRLAPPGHGLRFSEPSMPATNNGPRRINAFFLLVFLTGFGSRFHIAYATLDPKPIRPTVVAGPRRATRSTPGPRGCFGVLAAGRRHGPGTAGLRVGLALV